MIPLYENTATKEKKKIEVKLLRLLSKHGSSLSLTKLDKSDRYIMSN